MLETVTEEEANHRKRRLSNLFNPPEMDESSPCPSPSEEGDEELEDPAPLRRSSRKKIRTSLPAQCRVSNNPVKLKENSDLKNIKKYYLDKKVKQQNPSLETIFEEPQLINNEEVVMSTRKFRRVINFTGIASKNCAKIRKRKVKAKNVRSKQKPKKVTLKFLMEKLNEIEQD